ncbi:pilus assembly protein PilM [Sinimarinibacterium sp. NLF-5-8]|uniref:pilus assembly protein PilM n=1 Tax=Sinimarinibacterium sp. NLF-5-8 TaxID=2698684 RepID=UPI00137C28A7|nr:pilus assembly protein PilM [Sinimarinibacterium sp. NLF-5-8]QHS10780.1 pilus assembly protein PilM [Sinimarinibacterium sp. NLF-5-8]
MAGLQTLLRKNGTPLIGLDISSSAVKLLELSRKGAGYHVDAYATEPLPPGAIADRQIQEPKLVGEAVARAVKKAGTRARQVAVAVPGTTAITKIVEMPVHLAEDELEAQLKAEADQYIPYPIDEVSLDFSILGPNPKNSAFNNVLLAACRKEQVERLCAAVEVAGLKPRVVDVDAYALENACQLLQPQMPDAGKGRTIALIDMGASTTAILVLHDNKTVFTRDQAFGGRQLSEDIMRSYGMTHDQAQLAKRSGALPEGYATDVLEPFITDMAQQIDRSLQFFFSSASQFTHVDQLILAGGCAHINGVDGQIQQRLQIPTAIARPLAGMGVASRIKPDLLAQDEATLMIACGLALRAFDEPRP